jgi:hypothetical protein
MEAQERIVGEGAEDGRAVGAEVLEDVLDRVRRRAALGSGAAVGGVASSDLRRRGGAFLFFLRLTSSDTALEDLGMGGGTSGQVGGGSEWGHDALSRDGDGEWGGSIARLQCTTEG